MSRELSLALLRAIQSLEQKVESGTVNPALGICGCLEDIFELEMHLDSSELFDDVYVWFQQWPGHSGRPGYPVPSADKKLDALDQFYAAAEAGAMWTGAYGARRIELLKFISRKAFLAAHLN